MKASDQTLLLLLLFFALNVSGQETTPLLERKITISLKQEKLDDALKKIGQQGGFSFSYSPTVIETGKLVTERFSDKTVREILNHLFNGTVEYKVRNKHIILTKSRAKAQSRDEKTVSGYVVDEATGARLKNVSVYEPHTLSSTVTDAYGYFEIKVNRPHSSEIQLAIKKENYTDTTVYVPTNSRRLLNIAVRIDKKKIAIVADSVSQKIIRFWKTKILLPPTPNILNIQDTLHRRFQFSVIPFTGTNHRLSANVTNDFSFNLLGGYARGVTGAEIGGVFNIDREDVQWAQAAGVFNMVGGNFTGLQVAGVLNGNYGKTFGIQVAGAVNLNWDTVSAISVAGAVNLSRMLAKGAFVAGAGNVTLGKQTGPQIAGAFNLVTGDAGPFQLSPALNFTAGNFSGLQAGAVVNFTAGDVHGVQFGPVINFTAGTITGSQFSGVLNYATKVRGTQIGLVNFCDSISGVPLGVFSFVMKGYHKLEFFADEIFYSNIAFRTGVRKFYNILIAGAKPETFSNDSTFWTFGYGIGSARKLTRWASLNLDVTSQQVMETRKVEELNLLNKVYVGLDLHITKHVSLAFGVSLNGHVARFGEPNDRLFSDYFPKVIHQSSLNHDFDLQMWLGGKAGLRFF